MHVERTKTNTNHFVSVLRQVGTPSVTVHSDLEFACVWELLSTDFKVASHYHHIASIESSQVVGIRMRGENQTALNDQCIQFSCAVDIDKQVLALWNND